MTIDERIAFLVQSTESLHATAQELTAQVQAQSLQLQQITTQGRERAERIDAQLEFLVQSSASLHETAQVFTSQIQELTPQVKEHTKQLEIDAENIRRLANIAASHEQRIDDLEAGDKQ